MDKLKELIKQFPEYDIQYIVSGSGEDSCFPAVVTSAEVVDYLEFNDSRFFSKDTYLKHRTDQLARNGEYEDMDFDELKFTVSFESSRLPWKKVILVQLTYEQLAQEN